MNNEHTNDNFSFTRIEVLALLEMNIGVFRTLLKI